MKKEDLKKINLTDKPGVYFFYKGKEILYIGKATSLSSRINSYFGKDLINTRGPLILDMVTLSSRIKWQETDSVLEALILEANLIKKYQPKYNTKEKDNKSFNYVCITDEEVPKVLIVRGRGIIKEKYQSIFGPFPNGLQLRDAMKIIRKIFPFIDDQSSKKNNKIFYEQLGLTPIISVSQSYKNNIKNLVLFFQGKKKSVIVNLKKEMFLYAKNKEFEKAGEIKKRIFALSHINDVALIKEDANREVKPLSMRGLTSLSIRIEAYDISHTGGDNMVGVMVVITDDEIDKKEYKKFIIKTQDKANDTGALEEVLSRRLRHSEWGLPNIIVMDGGVAQINIAKAVLARYQFNIPIVSVVKDNKHKARAIIGNEEIIKKYRRKILLANDESHRFAITFHKKRREKDFLN
jgi:excinuclease ABC subunit C